MPRASPASLPNATHIKQTLPFQAKTLVLLVTLHETSTKATSVIVSWACSASSCLELCSRCCSPCVGYSPLTCSSESPFSLAHSLPTVAVSDPLLPCPLDHLYCSRGDCSGRLCCYWSVMYVYVLFLQLDCELLKGRAMTYTSLYPQCLAYSKHSINI